MRGNMIAQALKEKRSNRIEGYNFFFSTLCKRDILKRGIKYEGVDVSLNKN